MIPSFTEFWFSLSLPGLDLVLLSGNHFFCTEFYLLLLTNRLIFLGYYFVLAQKWWYPVLPIFAQFYRVLSSSTEFYRVLPSFCSVSFVLTGLTFDEAVTQFYRVLSSFTEFCRVLSSFTEFYRVLPSFCSVSFVLTGLTFDEAVPSFVEWCLRYRTRGDIQRRRYRVFT